MDDSGENRISEVMGALREAALRPDRWTDSLQRLATAFKAEGWIIKSPPASYISPICSPSLDGMVNYAMREEWTNKDVRLERCLLAFAEGRDILTESMIFSSWELDYLSYNSEFINRFNLRWFAAMSLAGEGVKSTVLELQRLARCEPFSGSEIARLRDLIPRLQEAGNSALRVARIHHKAMLSGPGTSQSGVVLLDWKGRVLGLNSEAEATMSPGLTVRQGVLRASEEKSDRSLQKLIHSVITQEPSQVSVTLRRVAVARPAMSPLLVQAFPLTYPGADRFLARAALTITDQRIPQVPDLQQTFRLTRSEAEVALALAKGYDVAEIAELRRVSPGTLRAQLRSIFAKTETRRQTELVRLLLRYPGLP